MSGRQTKLVLLSIFMLGLLIATDMPTSVADPSQRRDPVRQGGTGAFNSASVVFSDDFSTDPNTSGHWQIYRKDSGDTANEASWSSADGDFYLTRAAPWRAAAAVASYQLTATSWQAQFRYRVGGGSGSDGFTFMFYKDGASFGAPACGGLLGFHNWNGTGDASCAPYSTVAGYGIEFDTWLNPAADGINDPSSSHVALIKDSVANHLAYVNDSQIADNVWHDALVQFDSGHVTVSIDGGPVLDYTISNPDYTYSRVGFSAGTALGNDNHVIDDFVLTTGAQPSLYSISGRVTDGSSGCISGVSVSDGAGHTSPPSDTYGNYALSGLAAGTYTLGAVKSGCKFWPNAQPIVLSGDATQNFSEWTLGIGKVPVYLQGDPSTPSTLPWHPPWYNQTLLGNASGDTYDTVGRYGCALASYAMILGHYGQLYSPPLQTDPGDLNAHMQGLDPVSFEQYAWSKGVNVFQSGVGPANDFTGLHSQLTKGDLVMLKLGVSGSPTRVHYVVVTGETTVHNQATYTINDPVYGQVTLLGRYGKNDFQAAYYYMLGPTTFNRSAVEISAHSPVQLLVTDTQGRRVGYDPRTGLSYNEIPNAGYVTGAIAGPDGNTLPEFKYVLIPQPSSSSYYLQVIGTGTGGYTIDVIQTDSSGKGSVSRQSGTAQLNSVYSYTIRAASALFLPLIVR